jgi:hypothetical protein
MKSATLACLMAALASGLVGQSCVNRRLTWETGNGTFVALQYVGPGSSWVLKLDPPGGPWQPLSAYPSIMQTGVLTLRSSAGSPSALGNLNGGCPCWWYGGQSLGIVMGASLTITIPPGMPPSNPQFQVVTLNTMNSSRTVSGVDLALSTPVALFIQ